jgi:hypothetical protein
MCLAVTVICIDKVSASNIQKQLLVKQFCQPAKRQFRGDELTAERGDVHKLKRLVPRDDSDSYSRKPDQVNERLQPSRAARNRIGKFEHSHAGATEQSDRSAIGGFVAADSGLSLPGNWPDESHGRRT